MLGVAWVFRRELNERYESRLTDALVKALDVIAQFNIKATKTHQDILRENRTIANALLIAASMARGIDLDLVYIFHDAFTSDQQISQEKQRELLNAITDAIVGWRGQQEDPRPYIGVLKRFSEKPSP